MKITVDLPESDLREITRITGLKKKGPAIRKLVTDTLRLQKRAEISAKFLSGEWSAALPGYEAAESADLADTLTLADSWRD